MLSPRERATVIVALLYWHASTKGQDRLDYLGFAREAPLDDAEILDLAQRLDVEGMQEPCQDSASQG